MDSSTTTATTTGRQRITAHLKDLLKAGLGGLVVASATIATEPPAAEASASSTSGPAIRRTIDQRVAEVRKQVAPPAAQAGTPDAEMLLAWGNWHNWRNGWPNGWHNWHNWGNY